MVVTRWTSPLTVSFLICFSEMSSSFDCKVTRPPDMNNCKLNASSPFSFVVKIWDDKKKVTGKNWEPGPVSFGSLIRARAALSSAWYFWREIKSPKFANSGGFTRFTVIGQNIWDYENPKGHKTPCYQYNNIVDIKIHPKAREDGERMYFDFSVIVLNAPFKISTPYFPSMIFSSQPLELLLQIRFANVHGDRESCAMPVPSRITAKHWVFNDRIDFTSLPFHTQCIKYLCQQVGSTQWFETCERNFNKRLNATILCMVPGWTKYITKDFPHVPSSYSGIPLIWNQSTIGISAQIKERVDYTEYNQDIFFVVTLLRIYPWLKQMIQADDPGTPTTTIQTKSQLTDFVEFSKPRVAPKEDWGKSDFYRLPNGETPFKPFVPVPKGSAPGALCCQLRFWKNLIISLFLNLTFNI